MSYLCHHCHRYPLEDCILWVSTEHGDCSKKWPKQCCWWCAACGEQYNCKAQNGVLVIQDSVEPIEAEVLRAHAPPQGPCDGLVVALELPASLQKGADNLTDTILEALQEHSRSRITNELGRFIEVNNHEAVKIGDSEWNAEAIKVSPTSRRRSSRTRPSGKEWTTRHVRKEKQVRCAPSSTPRTRAPPLVDEDLHPIFQATRASRERNGRTCITRL